MALPGSQEENNKLTRQKSRQATSRNSTKLSLAVIDENALLSPEITEADLLQNDEKRKNKKRQRKTSKANSSGKQTQGASSPTSTDIQEYESRDPREELEEKRQEVIRTYWSEVRVRVRSFLKFLRQKRKDRLKQQRKEEKEQERLTKLESARKEFEELKLELDADQRITLPTITESNDEHAFKKGPSSIISSGDHRPLSSTPRPGAISIDVTDTVLQIEPIRSPVNNENESTDALNNEDEIKTIKSEEVSEMEKDAEQGIVIESDASEYSSDRGGNDEDDDSDDDEDYLDGEPPILADKYKKAMHDAVSEGNIELLEDMLDLPGSEINVIWYGENLLMTAIRAGQDDIATYLIDNGININYQVMRFEKRRDMQEKIDLKLAAAQELELEEAKKTKKKKKTTNKEKEKFAIEELEKEALEQFEAVKSPELNPPNALTDMDCFYTNCRALAVELQKEHVINLIDQENGEQWPSKIQPRKKEKRPHLRSKMEKREDWVHTDDEDSEEEVVEEVKPDPKAKSSKVIRNNKNPAPKKSESVPKKNNRAKESHKQGKGESSHDKSKLTASKEKLADSFTVAGETEPEHWSPTPELPLELILQPTDNGPTKTELSYRTTRSYLTRKSANVKNFGASNSSGNKQNSRKFVQSRGSFMAESRLWTPSTNNKDSTKRSYSNSRNKAETTKSLENSFNKVVDSFNDQLRYKNLRGPSNTRQFSPWNEDDPLLLSNMLQRSKSQITMLSGKANKPTLKRENTGYLHLKSKSNSSIFDATHSSSDWTLGTHKARPKTQGNEPSNYNLIRGHGILSRNLVRSNTDFINNNKHNLHSQQRSREGLTPKSPRKHGEVTELYKMLQISRTKEQSNPRFNVQDNNGGKVWAQRCVRNKTLSAKRYSPAGYLKGGHTKEELEQMNSMSAEQRKKETVGMTPIVTVY